MDACTSCGASLPEGARFCPTCAAPVGSEPERERKLATVVFADLVGSTELGGALDPERTRAMLERFYDAMSAEIDTAGGTLEKFAGDAVMAVFGAPASLEDHAERALHAALAMRRRLRELFGDRLELRTGVNTGEVVVGMPREGSSFVTGDPVNVAARLEQGAEPGEILVGERTVATARGAFEFGDRRTIQAKGKAGGVECRSLLRALSLMRPRGVGGLRRAFVGRQEEMETLGRVHEEVERTRAPQLVTILADAGVGKTRLLREFWDRLGERSPRTVRRTGRCLSYGQGITYWPLAEVLKEHLGIFESDAPAVVLERLGSREILALTLGFDVAQGLHPLAARDRFQDAWIEFIEEITAERPLVILIEDLHWGEEQLLDLLERLVRDATGPLLLIATARPELLVDRPGWGARLRATTLELEALSADESVRMLDELLGGTLPAGLRAVVDRAEGNPFFVEELLGTLIDRRMLERQNGSWRLAELPPDFAVPDTVQAVVASRVDLLEPPEKQALQAASVIGRIFWARPVYELVPDAEPDLRILEDRDFIRRRPGSSVPGDREYAIKHALTREVAYASLPKVRRAKLHAAFARWVERSAQGRDEDAPILAHHYAEAVRPDDADLAWASEEGELVALRARALHWLRRAAELAIGRFEIDEGLALLHRALDLEPDRADRTALWREIGRANVFKFDGEAFWTAMLSSLEDAPDDPFVADTYSILAFHTATRAAMWRRRPDHGLIAGWIDRALELSRPDSPARARALIARAFLDPDEAGETARDASDLSDRIGDVELRSWAWGARFEEALARGDFEEACGWARKRFDLVPTLDDPDHIALIYMFAMPAYVATVRLDEARRLAEIHDDVTARLTPHHRMHAAALMTEVELVEGRWEAVRDLTARVEAAVAANVVTPCASNVNSLLACALANVHLGDEQEARRLEKAADDLGMEGYRFDGPRIDLALARGDLDEVERRLTDWRPDGFWDFDGVISWIDALVALDRREEIEAEVPPFLREGTYLEPFVLRALGYARGDVSLIRKAEERFEGSGMAWHAAETSRLASKG